MEDYEIICLFWKRDEMAIKHTEVKYGGKLCHLAMKILNSWEDTFRKSDDDSQIPVSIQSYDIGEPIIESTSEQDSVDSNSSVSEQDNNYNVTVSEQNGNAGEPVIESCYDNPDNPVANQNYSVGEPNNEYMYHH